MEMMPDAEPSKRFHTGVKERKMATEIQVVEWSDTTIRTYVEKHAISGHGSCISAPLSNFPIRGR